jgi:hypothetical protein
MGKGDNMKKVNDVARVIYDGSVQNIASEDKWTVVRLSMAVLGESKCKKGIPDKMKDGEGWKPIPFTILATSREMAKQEIIRKVDQMFDMHEAMKSSKRKGE